MMRFYKNEKDFRFNPEFLTAASEEFKKQGEKLGIQEAEVSKDIDSLRDFIRGRVTKAMGEIGRTPEFSDDIRHAGANAAVDIDVALRMYVNTNACHLSNERFIVYHDTFTYALQRIYECLEHPKFTAKMLLEAVQFVKNIKDGKENMDEDVSERINRMTVKGKNLEWMMGPTGDGLIHSLEFDITWERIEKLVGNKRLNKATREEVKKLIGAFLKKIGLRLGPALQNRGEL